MHKKRVRRYLHLDYYYPNMTEADRAREDAHIGKLNINKSGTVNVFNPK